MLGREGEVVTGSRWGPGGKASKADPKGRTVNIANLFPEQWKSATLSFLSSKSLLSIRMVGKISPGSL